MYALVMFVDADGADAHDATDVTEVIGLYDSFDQAQDEMTRCYTQVAKAIKTYGMKAFPYGFISFHIDKVAYDTPQNMVANFIDPEWPENN